MRTRNQLNSETTKASDLSNNSTDQLDNDCAINETPSISTPPPQLRLRDRRSFNMDFKGPVASSAALAVETEEAVTDQEPSPPAGPKRSSSTGPTRILPRRSCGRPTSLLAETQPKPGAISRKLTSLLAFKKHTHPQKDSSSPSLLQFTNSTSKTEMYNKIDTANINNNNESSLLLSNNKCSTSSDRETVEDKTEHSNNQNSLLRISLPDKPSANTSRSGDFNASFLNYGYNSFITTTEDLGDIPNGGTALEDTNSERDASCSDIAGQPDSGRSKSMISNSTTAQKTFNVLLGVTGSVATIKLVELTKKIKSMFPRPYTSKNNSINVEAQICIKIVMTSNSKHFASKEELIKNLDDPNIIIHDDDDEWTLWKKMDDPVLHIELRKWADLCLIAPLDANTMAKLSTGICDNLLTCVVRAWDVSKPLIYCPAMNVHMYNHPLTREHLCKLQSFGYLRVDCVEKRLACGDFGMGGMASVESIANKVVDSLIKPVTQKISLTRSILNQQPTYPIISLTGDEMGSLNNASNQSQKNQNHSISTRILDRFRTSNQITIHPVPNSASRSSQSISLLGSGGSLMSRKRAEFDVVENLNGLNGSKTNGRNSMGGVTSLRNLKAIGAEDMDMIGTNYDELSDFEVEPEETPFEFDPSNLLEQYMTTEDPGQAEPEQMVDSFDSSSGQMQDRNSSFGEGSIARMGGLTPLFNTSKFLALCHNKERGCFTCTICKHDYKNRKSMARHLKEQHVQGNIYQCKPCGVSYKRREKLIKHNRERHPDA